MDHLTNLTTTSQPFFTFQTNKKIQSMDTSTPNTSSFQFLTNTPSLLTTSLKKKQMDSSFSFFKHMPTFKNHQDHEHSEKTMKHKKEEEEEEEEEDEDEEEEEEEVMIENADENNLSLTTATDLGSKTKEESMTMDLSSSSSSSSSSRSGMEEKERKEKKDEKKLHLKSKKTSNVSMSIPPASSSIQEDLSSSTFVKPLETPPPLFTFKTPPFPLPLSLPLPLPSSSSSSLSCKKKRRSLTHGSLVEEEPLEEEEKKMGLGVDQSKEETDIPRKAKKRKKEREEVTNLHEKNVSFSLPPTVVVHETNLVHKENDDDDDEEEEETSQVKRKEPFLSSKLKKTKKTMHLPWVLNTMPCSLDTWNQWIQQLIHQVEENELENEGLKTQLMDLEYQLKHQSKFIQDLKKQYQTWMATQQQHSQTTFHQQLDTWRKEVQQQEETLLQRVQDMLTTWQTSWQTWVAEHVDPPPPLPSPTACSLPPSLQAQLDQWPSQFNALETNLKTHCAQLHETLQSEFQTHFLPKLKETLLALPPFWETERWDTWVTTTIQKAWSEDAMNPLFSPPYSTLATFLMQTWPSEVTASFHSLTTSLSQHHQTLVTFEPLLQTLLRVCQTDLVNTHLTPIREHLDHPASWLSTGLTQVLPSLLLQHHQTHVLPFHHHTTAVLESLQKSLHDPPHLLQQALRDSVEPLLLSHTQRWEKSSFADLPTRLDQLVQLVQLGLKDLNDLIQAHHVSNDIDHPLKQELETTKQQLLESNQLNERLRKEIDALKQEVYTLKSARVEEKETLIQKFTTQLDTIFSENQSRITTLLKEEQHKYLTQLETKEDQIQALQEQINEKDAQLLYFQKKNTPYTTTPRSTPLTRSSTKRALRSSPSQPPPTPTPRPSSTPSVPLPPNPNPNPNPTPTPNSLPPTSSSTTPTPTTTTPPLSSSTFVSKAYEFNGEERDPFAFDPTSPFKDERSRAFLLPLPKPGTSTTTSSSSSSSSRWRSMTKKPWTHPSSGSSQFTPTSHAHVYEGDEGDGGAFKSTSKKKGTPGTHPDLKPSCASPFHTFQGAAKKSATTLKVRAMTLEEVDDVR